MKHSIEDKAIALAGLAQFALYAHELATKGNNEFERMALAKRAIYCTNPSSVMDVFGEASALNEGIRFLTTELLSGKKNASSMVVARYMGQLMRLANQVLKSPSAQDALGEVIEQARQTDDSQEERILNDGYKKIISPLKPQIMLHGHPSYLENTLLQARARILLLAAVRSGFLWRQCGGRFSTMIFRRKALLAALQRL